MNRDFTEILILLLLHHDPQGEKFALLTLDNAKYIPIISTSLNTDTIRDSKHYSSINGIFHDTKTGKKIENAYWLSINKRSPGAYEVSISGGGRRNSSSKEIKILWDKAGIPKLTTVRVRAS